MGSGRGSSGGSNSPKSEQIVPKQTKAGSGNKSHRSENGSNHSKDLQ